MRAFLDYGVEEEPWHERIVGPSAGNGHFYILTPDKDEYIESLAIPPLHRIRSGDGSRYPTGLGVAHGEPVYAFRQGSIPHGDELASFLE